MTCFFCFRPIDQDEKDGGWCELFNGATAHVACLPRQLEAESGKKKRTAFTAR